MVYYKKLKNGVIIIYHISYNDKYNRQRIKLFKHRRIFWK